MFCSSLAPKDDEVEDCILSYLFVSTTVPMDQRKRKLSHAVIVHCTDVHVPLERLRGEKKIELEIVHCGKRLLNIYIYIYTHCFCKPIICIITRAIVLCSSE